MTTNQRKTINEADNARDFSLAIKTPNLQLNRKIQRFNEMLLKRGRELLQEAADYKNTIADKNDAVGGFAVVSCAAERFVSDEALSVINELYNGIDGRLLAGLKDDDGRNAKLHSGEMKKVYRAG